MKSKLLKSIIALAVTAVAPLLHAQLNIPYADGSDGVLNFTTGTNVIYLANAVTGVWTNTSTSPGNGIYDPAQWAVVFKYSSVNIASGATLTFSNNATHAPVVWLVDGNVTINGTLSLNGQEYSADPVNLPEPGPGGFRGGGGALGILGRGNGPGFGPGGSSADPATYSGVYGNPQVIPLIGGSAGGGNVDNGAGGGGAILIAASGNITVNGSCLANGGFNGGNYSADANRASSGGAIRLVANEILGTNGTIQTLGNNGTGNGAYAGYIRLEANSVDNSLSIEPNTPPVPPANPPTIFPATNAPTVTVLSVNGTPAPADPKAMMPINNPIGDDLSVVATSAVTIRLMTSNFPTNGTVTVYIKPRNSGQTTLTASFVSGNTNSALWQVSASLPYPMHSVIQAYATY